MIFFVTVFIVPLLIACAAFLLSQKICTKELFVIVGVQLFVASVASMIVYYSALSDTEIWNGVVIQKEKVTVSCEHSYSCNCRQSCSGSGKNKSCYTKCDTCHEHFHDYDWVVRTSNDEKIKIHRIDRQGTKEPERWTSVSIGDDTAVEHSYENYVKASPDSLFVRTGALERFKQHIPTYPEVYDYYHVKRLISVNGAFVNNQPEWEKAINDLSSKYGKKFQLNVFFIIVEGLERDYYYALEQAWLGAKNNDIVFVVGLSGTKINWVEIMMWDTSADFKTHVKNSLEGNELSLQTFVDVFESNVMLRHRKPMKEFEYLKSNITPTAGEWTFALLVGLILSGVLSVFFHKNEIFNEYGRNKWQRY